MNGIRSNNEAPSTCPNEATLKQFLQGRLDAPGYEDCESHVADCPECHETLRGLNPNDTLSTHVAAAMEHIAKQPPTRGDDGVQSDSREIESLIDRLTRPGGVGNSDRISGVQRQFDRKQQPAVDPELLADRAAEVLRCVTADSSGEKLGTIGNYRLLHLLGAGSTGVVFQAIDETLDRKVALKVLRPSLGSLARERFMAEARVAASLDHRNVVTIYQVGRIDRLAFMAMQWSPGNTLETVLDRQAQMEETESRRIVRQIAAGLVAAHRKQMVHRDIKPANIWICDESGEVKILDFGLARIADDDGGMTATGMLAGTPNYMSPEQTRGQELDGRSDLFSLGCVMYRLTTGLLPFGSPTILATLQSIQSENPPPPASVRADVSQEFSDLTMSLLEKNPGNRPESADQLIQMLELPRGEWPRPVLRYVEQRAASSGEIEKTTVKKPAASFGSGRSGMWRWIAAGLLALVGLAAIFNGQQIIRIMTDQGEIVIDAKDESVEIEILQNGKRIQVVDTRTQQRLDIRSGEYEFKVSGSGEGDLQNSFQITPDSLQMKRGESTIVTVTRIENPSEPGVDTGNREQLSNQNAFAQNVSPADPDTQSPVFGGRDFNHWLDIASRDRDPETVCQALKASGRLASRANEADKLLSLLQRLVREYGSNVIGANQESDRYHYAFMDVLAHQPDDRILDFLIREIRTGNENSLAFGFFLTYPGTVFEEDVERSRRYQRSLVARATELLDACVDRNKANRSGQVDTMFSSLCSKIAEVSRNRSGRGHGEPLTLDNDAEKKLKEWVMKRYRDRDLPVGLRRYLLMLVHNVVGDDLAFYAGEVQRMFDPDVSPEIKDDCLSCLIGSRLPADTKALALLMVLGFQFDHRSDDLESVMTAEVISPFALASIDWKSKDKITFSRFNSFEFSKVYYDPPGGMGGMGGGPAGGSDFLEVTGAPAVARQIVSEIWLLSPEISPEFREKTLVPFLASLIQSNEKSELFGNDETLMTISDMKEMVIWNPPADPQQGMDAGGSSSVSSVYPEGISRFVKEVTRKRGRQVNGAGGIF